MPGPKKVIIDCDTGVDDAQAIMCALSRPDLVEVIAVTCVQGNVDLFNVCQNTLRVLKVCDRLDIPVYRGIERSLMDASSNAACFHGRDGMGEVENAEKVDLDLIKTEHAAIALVRLINGHPGEITLVAIGPLSNVAMALKLDRNIGKKLKELVIMGGNIEGKGNITPASEFNFHSDPISANAVLTETGCPILIVSWELCVDNGLPWSWFNQWIATDTKKGRFHQSIHEYSTVKLKEMGMQDYVTCDPLAMCIVLDKTVATEIQEIYAEVEVQGHFTRGQMICDWRRSLGKEANVCVVKKVDKEKLQKLYEAMVQ